MDEERFVVMAALEIVSLDLARPVYSQFGLAVREEEALRGVARELLASARAGTAPVEAIVATLRSTCDVDDATVLLGAARREALSDCDFALCSRAGLTEIPERSEYFPFVDAVVLTISMAKFQSFWRWLVPFAGKRG